MLLKFPISLNVFFCQPARGFQPGPGLFSWIGRGLFGGGARGPGRAAAGSRAKKPVSKPGGRLPPVPSKAAGGALTGAFFNFSIGGPRGG